MNNDLFKLNKKFFDEMYIFGDKLYNIGRYIIMSLGKNFLQVSRQVC